MISALIFTAAAAFSNFQSVQIIDVHDGDTFRVQVPRQAEIFGRKLPIRVRGIDSPETKSERACEKRDAALAREELQAFLESGRVDLNRCQRDKYFRIVCDVHIFGDETADIAAHMLAVGLAQPYDGRKKTPWKCIK